MWDYLIVTAANDRQAAAYEFQIETRRRTGLFRDARHVLVLADAGGRRIGSGGSTLQCLHEVLRRETALEEDTRDFGEADTILSRFRILIVHAGGDSRRLPAYSPCGKIFVPLPGDPAGEITPTIFDRLVPSFFSMQAGPAEKGQIVVASGDALLLFDSAEIDFSKEGITALDRKRRRTGDI